MKYYIDTSTWIAAFIESHPMHKRALDLLVHASDKGIKLMTCSHTLAELYSVLTKLPDPYRLSPQDAHKMITRNVIEKAELENLDTSDYTKAIYYCASNNIVSGGIYDGLHAVAAQKAKASTLVTGNKKDFVRFRHHASFEILEIR